MGIHRLGVYFCLWWVSCWLGKHGYWILWDGNKSYIPAGSHCSGHYGFGSQVEVNAKFYAQVLRTRRIRHPGQRLNHWSGRQRANLQRQRSMLSGAVIHRRRREVHCWRGQDEASNLLRSKVWYTDEIQLAKRCIREMGWLQRWQSTRRSTRWGTWLQQGSCWPCERIRGRYWYSFSTGCPSSDHPRTCAGLRDVQTNGVAWSAIVWATRRDTIYARPFKLGSPQEGTIKSRARYRLFRRCSHHQGYEGSLKQ